MKISSSSIGRVILCHASASQPEGESISYMEKYQERGKKMHAVFSEAVQVESVQIIKESTEVDEGERALLMDAWRTLQSEHAQYEGETIRAEFQLDLSALGMVKTGLYETEHCVDIMWKKGSIIFLRDLKTGSTPVPAARENYQLMTYAWGLLDADPTATAVNMGILQPMIGPLAPSIITRREVNAWAARVIGLISQVKAEEESGNLVYTPGPEQCGMCAHSQTCTALANFKADKKVDKESAAQGRKEIIEANPLTIDLPPELQKSLVLLSSEAVAFSAALLAKAKAIPEITTKEEADAAGLIYRECQKFEADMEKRRVEAKAPVNALAKAIDGGFKAGLTPAGEGKKLAGDKVEKFLTAERIKAAAAEVLRQAELKQQEEDAKAAAQILIDQAKKKEGPQAQALLAQAQELQETASIAQQEQATAPVTAAPAKVEGLKVGTEIKWEILDISLVPEIYLKPRQVDEAMLKAALKSKKVTTCAWVKVWEAASVGGKA